jgi:hypothetical protein
MSSKVGRVSIINGDRSIISTALLICQDELVVDKTGNLKTMSVVKIKSDVDNRIYQICGCEHAKLTKNRCTCDRWITKFKDQVIRPRVTPPCTHIPHPPAADQPRTPAPLPRTRTLLNLNLPPLPPQLLLFAQQTSK